MSGTDTGTDTEANTGAESEQERRLAGALPATGAAPATTIAVTQSGNRWASGRLLAVLAFLAAFAILLGYCASQDDDSPTSVEASGGAIAVVGPTADAISAAGFDEVVVSGDDATGRIILSGIVVSEAERAGAEEIARGIEGVTAVDNRLTIASAPAQTTTSEASATTTTTSTTTTEVAAAAAASDAPEVTLEFAENAAVLAGTVASEDVLTAGVDAASEALRNTVESRLVVDDVTEDGGSLTVTGEVASTDVRDQNLAIAEDIAAAMGIDDVIDQQSVAGNTAEEQSFEDDLNALAEAEPITFASGSAIITPEGLATLDKAAPLFLANPDVPVLIEGHTDNQGSAGLNQVLSENRAAAVVDYLVTSGVDGDRLTSEGFGPSEPVADNSTAAGRAENRRIEFRVNP